MNAEVLIRARKVFVEDKIVEYSETCPHCASKGLSKKLRYFYLSLDEAIYKCENEKCLYPFERFMFKNLTDNSVYYYEEVFDGGRDAYLKVPLDGQSPYETQNPISTKTFCDSQRNPNIENYSCDFSDLFNDFETELEPQVKPPAIENSDFLDFLDDTVPKSEDFNASEILDENGIDNLINNILNESPIKVSPLKKAVESTQTSQQIKQSTPKLEPKLSKCLQHIQKVKIAKNKSVQEKTKESFATTMKKARKSPLKVQHDHHQPSIKTEPKSEQRLTSNQQQKSSTMATLIKSTGFLRPTELAQRIDSLRMTTVDSEFLRQYMKVKEEKLAADESSSSQFVAKKNIQQTQTMTVSNSGITDGSVLPNILDLDHKGALSNDETAVKKKANSSSEKRAVEKEPIGIGIMDETAVKKVRKPRARKPKAIENKTETCDSGLTPSKVEHTHSKVTEVKEPPKRKPSQKKKNGEPPEVQKIPEEATKPEEKKRNSKSNPPKCDNKPNQIQPVNVSTIENPSVKKPQKSKKDTEIKTDQSDVKEKPKRQRSSKSKTVSIATDKDSGTSSPAEPLVTFTSLTEQPSNASGSGTPKSLTDIDSETSTEQLFGFSQPDKCPNDSEMLAVVATKTQKPIRKASAKRKSEGMISDNRSTDRGSSKRSKKNGSEAKVTNQNDVKKITPQTEAIGDFIPNESTPTDQNDFENSVLLLEIEKIIDNSSVNKEQPLQYYQRKTFRRDMAFEVDKILNDWSDSESEHSEKQKQTNTNNVHLQSVECQKNDDAISVISVTSETSDSSFAFVG